MLVLFPTRGGPERFQRFLQIHVAYRTASIRPQEVYICPFFLACSPTSSRVDTRSFDILHPPTSRSSVLKSSRCLPNTPTSSPSAPSLPCSRHTTTVPVCCFDQHFDHFQHRLTNSHRRCRQRLGHQCFLPLRHLPASHGPLPDL